MSEAILTERVDVASIEMRVVPASYNEADRTFEIVFSTGAAVRRYSWRFGEYYHELLSLDPAHVRLERINTGRAPFVQDHDTYTVDKVIGSIVAGSVRLADGKMIGLVQMHETERAIEQTARMARGELCSVSLGYQTYEHVLVERDGEMDQRTATDWEPYELSLVSIPADNDSHTRNQPHGAECVIRNHTESNMSGTTGTKVKAPKANAQKRKANDAQAPDGARSAEEAGSEPTEPRPAVETTPDERSARKEAALEERTRAAEIRMHAKRAGVKDDVAEKLIKEGKSVLEAREAIIDAWSDDNRGEEISSTVGVETEERDKVKSAMERALLNRHDPRKYKIEDGDDARHFGGDSLLDLGVRYVSRIGEKLPDVGNKMVRAGLILGQRIGGMHVSSDFSHILANVAGKTLQDSYREAPRAFEPLVRPRAVSDFKPVSVTKLGPASDLDEVKEGAEYSRATVDDTGETYKLLKYGKVIAISREAIINDDLDAFSRLPASMGRKARRLESQLFFSILTDNPNMADGLPLFHVDHGNIVTGSLDKAGLEAANLAMRLQTDMDGSEIELMPSYLLTPIALEVSGRQLVVLQTVPTRSEDTNPFQGSLSLISTPYLDRDSSAAWYEFADPADIDTIEMAFLQGEREPYFETREGFDVDGTEIKIRHQVAMKAIDFRGVVKSTG